MNTSDPPPSVRDVRALIERMRNGIRFRAAPGGGDVISANTVDQWADELEALIGSAPQQKEGCINCGERNDGGYVIGTEEDGIAGPFCSSCFGAIEDHYQAGRGRPWDGCSGHGRPTCAATECMYGLDQTLRPKAGTCAFVDQGSIKAINLPVAAVDPLRGPQEPEQ